MSTRSGKRIHASIGSPIIDTEFVLHSDRKTRSKKPKENVELSVKKRHNYVSYPGDDDTASASSDTTDIKEKVRRTGRHRKNTLREHNTDDTVSNVIELNNNSKSVRKSRRGKKVLDVVENGGDIENNQYHEQSKPISADKKKSKKKKNHKVSVESAEKQGLEEQVIKKKSNKKNKKSSSFRVHNDEGKQNEVGMLSRSNMSVDEMFNQNYFQAVEHATFTQHQSGKNLSINNMNSADVSPVLDTTLVATAKKQRKCSFKNSTFKVDMKPAEENSTENLSSKKKGKSSIENSTYDKIEISDADEGTLNVTFDKSTNETTPFLNAEMNTSTKKRRNSSIKNSTFDKIETNIVDKDALNATFDKANEVLNDYKSEVELLPRKRRKSSIKIEKEHQDIEIVNTTFDKTNEVPTVFHSDKDGLGKKNKRESSMKNFTLDKIEINETKHINNEDFNLEVDCNVTAGTFRNAIKNTDKFNPELKVNAINNLQGTFENDVLNDILNKTSAKKRKSSVRLSMIDKVEKECDSSGTKETNITFDIDDESPQNKESFQTDNNLTDESKSKDCTKSKCLESSSDSVVSNDLNTTYDTDKKPEKINDSKKSSIISSDATVNSTFDNSHTSITSDESKSENILNHTPVLIESSIDASGTVEDKTPEKSVVPLTPLKRESTFTKDGPDIVTSPKSEVTEKTTANRKSSPGHTPFLFSKSSQKEESMMNVTWSIKKSSLEAAPRHTRVMFCSPVNNAAVASHMKGKVIKSNLKGSNKSFVFDDTGRARKRSLTQGEGGAGSKRSRLADGLQLSVDRLSRPRTLSAAAKLADPGSPSKKTGTPSKAKPGTPSKAKPEGAVSRTRLPNFAALHQKQFARMESLDECQERKARRARQLLTPTGCVTMLERISPKGTSPQPVPAPKESSIKLDTPARKKLPTLDNLVPGYTRFGFKLKGDVNPFSITGKTEPKKERPNGSSKLKLSRQTSCLALPSLAGATGGRRDAARQAVMREKSVTDRRDVTRKEVRTIIKGVRTNRRFELQMKLRNVDA